MRKLSENKEITKITKKFLFSFESHIFQAFFVFKNGQEKKRERPKEKKEKFDWESGEKILLPYVKKNRRTPISFAIAMSSVLGVPVEPKLVWKKPFSKQPQFEKSLLYSWFLNSKRTRSNSGPKSTKLFFLTKKSSN